jgi:hypothetical protein
VHPTPFPLADFDLHVGWHERHRQEPGHLWFRQQMVALAAELAAQ